MRHLLVLLALLALLPARAQSADAPCLDDFDAVATALREDYGGRDLLLVGPEGEERAATLDDLRAAAASAQTPADCDDVLHRATGLFPDGHLRVSTPRPGPPHPRSADVASHAGGLSLRFVGDSAAVLRIPTFRAEAKAAIDSVVFGHLPRLLSRPYLVIDITGNGGGSDASFQALAPLLYTGPLTFAPIERRASPGNIAYYEAELSRSDLVPTQRAFYESVLADLQMAEGGWTSASSSTITLDIDNPYPRAVALVVDAGTASSAEELVLAAAHSTKVTTVGRPTFGALDYSNLRPVPLPSGERTLMLPTSRRLWPDGFSVDAAGIAPAVRVPDGVDDWSDYALGYLMGRASL